MNPFAFSGLIIAITSIAVGFFVFLRDPKRKLYIFWLLFTLSVAGWGVFNIFLASLKEKDFSLILWRLAFACSITWIPTLFLHFVYEFCQIKKRLVLYFAYLFSLASIPLFFSPLFLSSNIKYFFNSIFYPLAGSFLYTVYFVLWTLLFTFSLVLLASSLKTADEHRKKQIHYTFLAICIGAVGGVFNYIPSYNVSLYPWTNFLIPFYPMIIAFAIVKHQLMDIEVIVRRATVFAGLFTFVYGAFTAVTLIGQQFFKNSLGWNQWLAMIPTVLIITFGLRPLEIFLTNATERFLFQKKYDYRELLRTFTNEILTILDLQKLMDQTIAGLVRIVKLESASVLLFSRETKVYRLIASEGVRNKDITFKESDELVTCLKAANQHILKDSSVDTMKGHSALRENFKALNAKLCLPIQLHDELIGILCLGTKKSGADFTNEDIDILTTLARTEAIAISNARLFDELSKTQAEAAQREKMAVIGTLAAGINHEICNPLGIVRGQCELFLLNFRDGFYKDKTREEVLDLSSDIFKKVIKETDRATAITKKLSSFSKPSRKMDFENVNIPEEIVEVLGLINHELKLNNVNISNDFPENFPPVFADRKQIQEVLFNILRNAGQAIEMDKGTGDIQVTGFLENGSVVVRISDNGPGIPKDKLEQIFHPFYTTKVPGKGTGLGLFIVKQIMERNRGAIEVTSEFGYGTQFTLKFPVIPIKEPAQVSEDQNPDKYKVTL